MGPTGMTRREMVACGAAAGLAVTWPGWPALGQTTRTIDFHHHFNPPFLVQASEGNRVGAGDANGLNWELSYSLEDMDKGGIAKSVLSPPTGFTERTDPSQRNAMIRKVNEYGAELVRDHPTRFVQLVYMPLPDVEASLKEITYGFDTLKVVGVGFATSYGEKYVSDPSFAPVFEELNRRRAVAYFHPLAGACCTRLIPGMPLETNLVEIPYDTARAVIGFLLSGAFRRYPDVKFVFSHSGGAVPMFAGRFDRLLQKTDLSKVAPDGINAEFRKLYYETANANSPPTMAALLKFAPLSQVMFGSDHPYVSDTDNLADLKSCGLSQTQMNAILYENAQRLIPGLRA
ncbi:MAG TPA: amidohydrolase family protein [Micropepsaceae bacterium]|nr:amidohydrolase family protein [Micropepsaceae bacterium]